MMRVSLFFLLTAFILSGCALTPKKEVVTQTKVVRITIPDKLLTNCIPNKPISKEEYLQLKIWEREQYLVSYNIYLLSVIKECNIKIDKIRELNREINNENKPKN